MRKLAIFPSLTFASLSLATLATVAAAQQPAKLPPAVITDTLINFVMVQNDRKAPVAIYLEAGNFDRRLGVVPALEMKALPLPAWAVTGRSTVRLFADPEDAAMPLATQEFKLQPPARVGMVVSAHNAAPRGTPRTMSATLLPEELADATITVDNMRNVPVMVFADQGIVSVRLGEVPANTRATLKFPKAVVTPFGSVQVFMHPRGGIDLASESFSVRPGAHIGVRVPSM